LCQAILLREGFMMNFDSISNPIIDREPQVAVRDPAVVLQDGLFTCFYSAVETGIDAGGEEIFSLYLDVSASRDLLHWSPPRRLTGPGLNFSSPGNLWRDENGWTMCVQSYPVPPGGKYGSEDSRLWLMHSPDLLTWSEPAVIQPAGAQVEWSRSHRQIDPYIVQHGGQWWCFYKNSGCLGLLVSGDLSSWREASPERPVLGPQDTPDGATVENPCVVWDGQQFVLFFAPCRAGRGVGRAVSDDLLHWREVRYLDFPELPWASGGPTAAFVMDTRAELGRWLMFFHGDRAGVHTAALGVAWSEDLEHWSVP
jgi:hypothetical protein